MQTVNSDVVERVRGNLMDGTYFLNRAASSRSVRLGGPPSSCRGFSTAVVSLGRLARQGDQFAQVASGALRTLPLYQTDHEMAAALNEAFAKAIRDGYDDVIGRSGPHPGRYSDHQRRFNLAEAVILAYWAEDAVSELYLGSVRGVGWALQAIKDDLKIPAHGLPEWAGASTQG